MADDPFLLRDLWTASFMSKGSGPTARDETYWRDNSAGMLARGRERNYRSEVFPELDAGRAYRMDRMLGQQSGGADVPPFGKWANPPTTFHAVPPFPGTAEPTPPETPPTPPSDQDPPFDDLASIVAFISARFNVLSAQMDDLRAAHDRGLEGTIALPSWLGGTQVVRLKPVKPGADGLSR